MSRTAKTFLASSIGLTTFVVWGVHYLQQKERDTMYAGVLRDDARQAAKRAEREAREKEFEEQARRRLYLEQHQKVSNPSDKSQSLDKSSLQPMDEVEFQGCKTCR